MKKTELQEGELRGTVTTMTSRTAGGQHRCPAGVKVLDSETPAERAERHRRAHAELDREERELRSEELLFAAVPSWGKARRTSEDP
jgi:hypothetical protein